MQKNLQSVSPVTSSFVSTREGVVAVPHAKSAPVELNAAQLKQVGGGVSPGTTGAPNGTW